MRYAVLFGPPNAGKSTLFNQLTGKKVGVVNYPGSTVDITYSKLLGHESVTVVDLPGIQSFMPRSDDEIITMTAITRLNELIGDAHPIPDLVICVIDATQCSRQLAMIKRLIDDGYPVMVVITMIDEAQKKGINIDHMQLATALGVSVFQVNGRVADNIDWISDGVAMNSVPCGRLIRPQPFGLDDMVASYKWAEQVSRDYITIRPVNSSVDFDRWLLHPVWGYGVFLFIMIGFFSLLFYVSIPFMDAIDGGISWMSAGIEQLMPDSFFRNFLVNGLVAGLGGIVVFLPQIFILFLGLGILESSGYLARSAVLIDKPLSKIGLSGRSFVPLLSGCACAIPAILATRSIPDARIRRLTMIAIPLMQCSARLPVYGLLLSVLLPTPIYGAIGLTAIYVGSIVLASGVVGVANRYVLPPKEPSAFMMTLPPWRFPVWTQLFSQVLTKTSRFLTGAGPIILVISMVLWGISEWHVNGMPLIHHIGQWIEPVFAPMGLDWRVGVAIILSFAAREVFVSALVVVFNISQSDAFSLHQLSDVTMMGTNEPLFTTGSMIGLVLFFMVAMQCGATLAVLKQECRSFRLPLVLFVGYIVLAYALSVAAHLIF